MEYPIFEDPPFDLEWFIFDNNIQKGNIDPDSYDPSFPSWGAYYYNELTKHIWYNDNGTWINHGKIKFRKTGEILKLSPGIYSNIEIASLIDPENSNQIDNRWQHENNIEKSIIVSENTLVDADVFIPKITGDLVVILLDHESGIHKGQWKILLEPEEEPVSNRLLEDDPIFNTWYDSEYMIKDLPFGHYRIICSDVIRRYTPNEYVINIFENKIQYITLRYDFNLYVAGGHRTSLWMDADGDVYGVGDLGSLGFHSEPHKIISNAIMISGESVSLIDDLTNYSKTYNFAPFNGQTTYLAVYRQDSRFIFLNKYRFLNIIIILTETGELWGWNSSLTFEKIWDIKAYMTCINCNYKTIEEGIVSICPNCNSNNMVLSSLKVNYIYGGTVGFIIAQDPQNLHTYVYGWGYNRSNLLPGIPESVFVSTPTYISALSSPVLGKHIKKIVAQTTKNKSDNVIDVPVTCWIHDEILTTPNLWEEKTNEQKFEYICSKTHRPQSGFKFDRQRYKNLCLALTEDNCVYGWGETHDIEMFGETFGFPETQGASEAQIDECFNYFNVTNLSTRYTNYVDQKIANNESYMSYEDYILYLNSNYDFVVPRQVTQLFFFNDKQIIDIAAGCDHFIAITRDEIFGCGDNWTLQLNIVPIEEKYYSWQKLPDIKTEELNIKYSKVYANYGKTYILTEPIVTNFNNEEKNQQLICFFGSNSNTIQIYTNWGTPQAPSNYKMYSAMQIGISGLGVGNLYMCYTKCILYHNSYIPIESNMFETSNKTIEKFNSIAIYPTGVWLTTTHNDLLCTGTCVSDLYFGHSIYTNFPWSWNDMYDPLLQGVYIPYLLESNSRDFNLLGYISRIYGVNNANSLINQNIIVHPVQITNTTFISLYNTNIILTVNTPPNDDNEITSTTFSIASKPRSYVIDNFMLSTPELSTNNGYFYYETDINTHKNQIQIKTNIDNIITYSYNFSHPRENNIETLNQSDLIFNEQNYTYQFTKHNYGQIQVIYTHNETIQWELWFQEEQIGTFDNGMYVSVLAYTNIPYIIKFIGTRNKPNNRQVYVSKGKRKIIKIDTLL